MAAFFKKPKYTSLPQVVARREIPEGLWVKCPSCAEANHKAQLEENLQICPRCGYHNRMTAIDRLKLLADPGSFQEIDPELFSVDALGFNDQKRYEDKLRGDQAKTGLNEAAITGTATIGGRKAALGIMDFRFRGASMGSVVGEKITRLIEHGCAHGLPVVVVCTSGGARMEEGMLSLMQMAKTSGALAHLKNAGLPYIAILTNPTTGGVTASFASLGDVILAEPGAYIGFAGLRVIQQTIKAELPKGFQTAEFLLDKGLVDRIIERKHLRRELALLLEYLCPPQA
jgi:acetyl-CoA carboxylase carboxyl transferase subunit beta